MLNRPGSGGSNPPASAKYGSLAQLDRARRYESRCREFESLTSHKTGDLAELAYCTGPENRQTETSQRFESFSLRDIALWCNGKHGRFWICKWWFESIWSNKTRSFGRLGVCAGLKIRFRGSTPRGSTKHSEVLQRRRGQTVNLLSIDFVGSSPTFRTTMPHGVMVSTADFESVRGGSNPSGATTWSLWPSG